MIWLKINSEVSLLTRVTLYAEFLPMRSRATCILLIEVWTYTLSHCTVSHPVWAVIMQFPVLHSINCCSLSLSQIFWALGTVFEVLLAILVMPTLGWRWLLALSTIPLFIFAILCFVSMRLSELPGFLKSVKKYRNIKQLTRCCLGGRQWLPESARYDVLTGNQEKALATLKRIATENGAPMPLGKLIAARQVRPI